MTSVTHETTLNFNTGNTQTISLSDSFVGSDKHLVRIAAEQGVITRDARVIDSGNRTLYLKWDSESPVTISLTIGDYNVTTLASELKTQLDASSLGGTWTVAYSPANSNFSITPGTTGTQWSLYVTDSGPEDVIGITGTITVDGETRVGIQGSDSVSTDTDPDLSGEKFAYIVIHKQGETSYTKIACIQAGHRINSFTYAQQYVTLCIDPAATYEISIMRMKKDGTFSPFGLGPTNMVTFIYYT